MTATHTGTDAPPPALSVVIPTFEDAQSLELTLRSLGRQTLPADRFEVIVARDGGSGDDYSAVSDFAAGLNVQFVELPEQGGRSAARNAGIRRAQAATVLFLDSDSYASPSLLERHLAFHEAATAPGVLIGRRNELGLAHLPAVLTGRRISESAHWRAHDGGDLRFPAGEPFGTHWLGAAWLFAFGHNVSAPRAVVTAIGGFDETFGLRWGWEDIEMFYRVDRYLGPEKRAFRYDAEALCYHLPHYRDIYQMWQDYAGNDDVIRAKYPTVDWEFVGMSDPFESAERIAHYRAAIADCVSREACRIGPAWQWLHPQLGGDRALWIGTGSADAPLGDKSVTFDYAAPAGETNHHLIGMKPPIPPDSLDAVVSVDFWRYLHWQDLCLFLSSAARLSPEIFLVSTDTTLSAGAPQTAAELRYLARTLRRSFDVTVLGGEEPAAPRALRLRPRPRPGTPGDGAE
ncbi:glycosyltransferase family 2 protein [Jidongwangia harbinensis]|uniref:glycosyltransferase family 2 protein n=1 Tax=Jidongwangia harbinensis TaxID=2878561 RepID=UPI001CD91E5B|nr:glycosyltransferase [Jidongwangia harbinensis]MCA2216675.1 glycosyltransferase [Jidongwangia harbinensis]